MAKRAAKKSTGRKKTAKKPIESYDHKDKKRANNPPVGLVTPDTDPDKGKRQIYEYDPHLDPQLVWAGKAEHTSFDVPTVSLHVHERIDPRTIVEAVRKRNRHPVMQQLSLFETADENPPLREAIEFYKHAHNWTNRMIAGDSLLVMNSLLEKEGMAGKVQMVYIDPPYGIRYGSNFQPFVNKRDVKDGKDEDLTQEPEMIRAFRDTWELGIHSYLTYLRDRLLLARELLHESGSCFVQISDENLHHVKELMDEVLGVSNFVGLVSFQTAPYATASTLPVVHDYLVWYAKERSRVKYRQLFKSKAEIASLDLYRLLLLPDGKTYRPLTREETESGLVPDGWRRYRLVSLVSQGASSKPEPFIYEGKEYLPPANSHWKVPPDKLARVAAKGRIQATKNSVQFRSFIDDFPVSMTHNLWTDTITGSFTDPKKYVVQTNAKVVERCLLMTTDPGDLVLDPTCGSGTTAFAAEQWGRRWITCDTSRVATALAKQRLMTALYNYYELAHPDEGVGSGFNYRTVPHVTLRTIAYDDPPQTETLYDQPYVDNKRARVSGPFTVEAVPAPAVRSLAEVGRVGTAHQEDTAETGVVGNAHPTADASVGRSGETLRQDEWRDELLKCGIRGKKKQHIHFSRVESLPGTHWLHADAETAPSPQHSPSKGEGAFEPERVVVSFGPEHAPLEQRQVEQALEEAQLLKPTPKMVVFASFQFDPEAAKDIDETNWPGITLLKVQMNTDLLTDDLKKKRSSNESFWMIGQPDVQVRRDKGKEGRGDKGEERYVVEVRGFDYYNPIDGKIESGDTSKIAMWMLDTDYDGRSLYPRQVFFPMAGPKDGWARLAKNLKAEIDEELIEAYRGTISLPFEPGEHKRVAVKIIDDRGIESLKIVEVG